MHDNYLCERLLEGRDLGHEEQTCIRRTETHTLPPVGVSNEQGGTVGGDGLEVSV